MRCLVRTLLLSGFGTAIYGSSHPASQGEHLISHYADMFGDHGWPESFHGEQIGVTTLTMARLQERLLEGPAPTVHTNGTDEAVFITRYGPELGKSCWKEFAQKRLDAGRAKAVNQRLANSWDKIRDRSPASPSPRRPCGTCCSGRQRRCSRRIWAGRGEFYLTAPCSRRGKSATATPSSTWRRTAARSSRWRR